MKTLLIYSGGLDSTTLLYKLLAKGDEVEAIGFNYNQKHLKELKAAREICKINNIPYQIIDLSSLQLNSALTNKDWKVPEGHYEEENMKQTVVPNRNAIMISIAWGIAISSKCNRVAYGAHAGDHAIYPDCRPDFMKALVCALTLGNWETIELYAPFAGMKKEDIVKEGVKLKVPYELTWSCYKGGDIHCGRCSTCTEKREAFKLAGVKDPTEYKEE